MTVETLDRISTSLGHVRRLLVTQRGDDRLYRSVGFLDYDGAHYTFSYLRSATEQPWFRSLPGLARVGTPYRSEELFPLFRERILSPRRPDYASTMDALDLPSGAEPFEVLARSGGHRAGDSIQVIPVPTPGPDGAISMLFFAHGVRHMNPRAQDAIGRLRRGHRLQLVDEPWNPVNNRALLVADDSDLALGYVPDPLVGFVHDVRRGSHALSVERANGPDVPYHYRLLTRLDGALDARQTPFEGLEWETVS